MSIHVNLTAKDVALIVCFTALYAVFAYIPIFHILGVASSNITASAITVPIIGILLGPYMGVLSAAFGGTIGFFLGTFFAPSLVSGIVAAGCAGLQFKGKRAWSILLYSSFLVVFGFYPSTGPAWLFPLEMWFQIIGLLILVSPLQPLAVKNLKSNRNAGMVVSFFIISLTSTLAGQISGSLTYMMIYPSPLGGWQQLWEGLTFVYPIERIIIASGAAFVGGPLFKVLRSSDLAKTIMHDEQQKRYP